MYEEWVVEYQYTEPNNSSAHKFYFDSKKNAEKYADHLVKIFGDEIKFISVYESKR